MRVIVVKDAAEMGKRAAKLIVDDMKKHATYVLGLLRAAPRSRCTKS